MGMLLYHTPQELLSQEITGTSDSWVQLILKPHVEADFNSQNNRQSFDGEDDVLALSNLIVRSSFPLSIAQIAAITSLFLVAKGASATVSVGSIANPVQLADFV